MPNSFLAEPDTGFAFLGGDEKPMIFAKNAGAIAVLSAATIVAADLAVALGRIRDKRGLGALTTAASVKPAPPWSTGSWKKHRAKSSSGR